MVHNNPAEAGRNNNRGETAGFTSDKGRTTKVLRREDRESRPAGWKAERRDPGPLGDLRQGRCPFVRPDQGSCAVRRRRNNRERGTIAMPLYRCFLFGSLRRVPFPYR